MDAFSLKLKSAVLHFAALRFICMLQGILQEMGYTGSTGNKFH
jgi:hypothetical protein